MDINKFKNMIREVVKNEIKQALQEELKPIKLLLKASINESRKSVHSPIIKENNIKSILPKKTPSVISSGDPLAMLMEETKNNLNPSEARLMMGAGEVVGNDFKTFTTENLQHSFPQPQFNEEEMWDAPGEIQSSSIPDYSALMNKLKENGKI